MSEPWLSLEEIAKHLGVAKESIYRWLDAKGFPGHKAGRLWRFKASEVDEWVRKGDAAAQETEPSKEKP